ncbi:MAG: calcium-binding protein [Pirellulaceae bacterium]
MLGDDELDGGDGDDADVQTAAWGEERLYKLGTDDFTLPPEFEDAEALHPSTFDPTVFLITPTIVKGLSIDGTAGDGRDVLRGQAGNDVMFGGADSDKLFGGDGIDYIDAGAGNDSEVEGNEGDDVIRGGAGDDVPSGGDGIDHILGDAGDDLLKETQVTDPVSLANDCSAAMVAIRCSPRRRWRILLCTKHRTGSSVISCSVVREVTFCMATRMEVPRWWRWKRFHCRRRICWAWLLAARVGWHRNRSGCTRSGRQNLWW